MATVRIQLRRGTASQWTSANPILAAGEMGVETDTRKVKIGDGTTSWTSLDYVAADSPEISEIAQDAINDALVAGTGITKSYDDNANTITVSVDTSVIATKAELAEVAQDSINDALTAGTGITKSYDDAANTLTVSVDTTTIATQAYVDQAESDAITTAAADATSKANAAQAAAEATAAADATSKANAAQAAASSDATTKANAAQAAAEATAASALSSHASNTTDIHGIADTANLVTVDGSQLISNKEISSPIIKGNLVLEGTTDNDYELTLTTDPTADRNIIFPDNSGTVALVSNLSNYAELAGATFTGAVSGTDLTLSGNLTVNGTTTTLNTTDLSVEDKNVTLGDTVSPSDATADGGGITLKGSTDKTLIWQDSTDSWSSSENFNLDANKTYKINGSIVLSNSEVLGKSLPSGTVIGSSDSQTLTNKSISLTDNTISGTLAEFNSALSDANFVSLTGVETLTNKTLQSPSISSPTGILKGDVELGNVDNTSDLDKPVSTATQLALDLKSNLADPTFTGIVVLPATTSIGNISSSEIETLDGVTSNIQTQLNARLESATAASTYAPIESPTFTGTVSGITKTMVGLSNVDNTADTAKPVSTATQSALDLKADLAGPTFTGTVTLPGTTSIGDVSSTEIGYVNGVTSAIQTQINAKAASADVSSHTSATTSVHGISDTAQLAYLNAASQTFTGSVEIDQNLTVDGNLTVNGTTFNASSTSIVVEDNMVQLAHQNAANTVDLGIVVAYNDGSAKHSGIVRDVSDSKWKIFKDVADEPATTVNFGQGSLDNLAVNNIEVAGVVFTDGTQTKEAVPSRTVIYGAANSNAITASATLSDLAYRDSLIEVNSASSVTLTVPPNSTAAFPIGASWDIVRMGSGGVVIAAGSGVTINATPGLNLRAQYSSATLFKRGTDSWLLIGDLSA